MWTAEANDIKLLDSYATQVEKDVNTKGDFLKDYEGNCQANGIIKCPYITSYVVGDKEGVRIANGVIDLPSWRAMLLSVTSVGSKVVEVQVHSCTLTPQHLLDLSKAAIKYGLLKSLRIQFSEVHSPSQHDEASIIAAIRSLLSDSTNLEYISLKSINITNEIAKGIASAFTENFRLVSVNLSQNNLSDEACAALMTNVKLNPNYKAFNLSGNAIVGTGTLFAIVNQYIGSLPSGTEDAVIKANTKLINDKNKGIKDVNKKRKKAGLPEFNEFPALPEFTKPVDGKPWFTNRSVEYVDLSDCGFTTEIFQALITFLGSVPPALVSDSKLKIILSRIPDSNVDYSAFQNLFDIN